MTPLREYSIGTVRPAVLLLRSVRAGGGYAPGNVQLHGLGAGPRAVGSVAIEAVEFGPPVVQRSARQQASYSFLSKSDFNHVAVSMLRVDNAAGQVRVELGDVLHDVEPEPHAGTLHASTPKGVEQVRE